MIFFEIDRRKINWNKFFMKIDLNVISSGYKSDYQRWYGKNIKFFKIINWFNIRFSVVFFSLLLLKKKTVFLTQKRFYSSSVADLNSGQLFDLKNFKCDDNSVSVWFPSFVVKKSLFFLNLHKREFDKNIMKNLKFLIIFEKFFLLLSNDNGLYFFYVEDFIDERFIYLKSFIMLNYDFIKEKDANFEKYKEIIINKGDNDALIQLVSDYKDIMYLEKFATVSYNDVIVTVIYEERIVKLFGEVKFVLNKILFFDDIIVMVKDKHIFFFINLLEKKNIYKLNDKELSELITEVSFKNGFVFI